MLLSESEMGRALERVKAAFPAFRDWEHNNAINESYSGFSLWGEFVFEPAEPTAQSFFITFDTYESTWTGHLTIGKPSYYWSSADCGDAHLLDTHACATLEDAIARLKGQIAELFKALSG
jgi:hypothetical protein